MLTQTCLFHSLHLFTYPTTRPGFDFVLYLGADTSSEASFKAVHHCADLAKHQWMNARNGPGGGGEGDEGVRRGMQGVGSVGGSGLMNRSTVHYDYHSKEIAAFTCTIGRKPSEARSFLNDAGGIVCVGGSCVWADRVYAFCVYSVAYV
jgi:hypothetical protein